MARIEKHKCALHPERLSTGKAASPLPLPARSSSLVRKNQLKCERDPRQQCRQSSFSLLETLSRQPAGRTPSCPCHGAGWLGMGVLGNTTANPPSAQGSFLSLQSSAVVFSPMVNTYLSAAPWAGGELCSGFRTSFILCGNEEMERIYPSFSIRVRELLLANCNFCN